VARVKRIRRDAAEGTANDDPEPEPAPASGEQGELF